MADQYRYFRIEARELTDALSSGLAQLARGGATASQVALLLRHAHTLKGAARVVSASTIADLAHAFEELLDPYRHSSEPVTADVLPMLQVVLDGIGAQVAALDAPPGPAREPVPGFEPVPGLEPVPAREPAPTPVPGFEPAAAPGSAQPRAAVATAQTGMHLPGDIPDEPLDTTARVWLSEIDDVISGVGQALAQVQTLFACCLQLADLRARIAEPPSPQPGGLLQKKAQLERAAENVQRVLSASAERMDRELRQVHDSAERLRLVPVESIALDLEVAARDVATAQGKRVRVDLSGGRIRLDAPVLAASLAALRQIVRNAVAHGIEDPAQRVAAGKPAEGLVRLAVAQSGNQVVFRCTDDGRGIDLAAVRQQLQQHGSGDVATASDEHVLELLMRGGVSTAPVLSEVSGRGIGLDVVRDAAHRLGGSLRVSTRHGSGTTVELTASGSLSAQQVLLVDSADRVALPLSAVRTTTRVPASSISRGPTGESLVHDGQSLAFMPLAAVLDDTETCSTAQLTWTIVILHDATGGAAALGVSRLLHTADIAIRPLPQLAPVSPVVSGVWLDTDGHPRLVLDPAAVIAKATRRRTLDLTQIPPPATILVVDDSLTTRMLEQSILQAAGYEVELAASAEEGLRMAASRPYALVLVDVEMPGMDGFAFVEQTRARAELRHLPCILVTTRSTPEDRQRGAEAGARGHIDKGEFHQGLLLTRIAELLAEAP